MRRPRRSHEGPGVAMRDVLLVERVDRDGVGGDGGRGTTGAGGVFGDLRRLRGCSNISTRSRQALIPCRIPDSAVRSDNAATACSGSGSSAPWCLRCSLISWPLHTARPVRTAPVARCDVMGMPALETSVAISSYACLTKADLDGFLPSPYNATS